MTEILTESFCERCGTRYTFESARPRTRLKGVKVLSRGLKNFVLSDDTSIDEAMAAARSESEREASSHQLDAFHKTFNFCMSCRQYTCPNCWNEAEARCLSCAPLAVPEMAPGFRDLPELRDAALVGEATRSNGAPSIELPEAIWPAVAEPEVALADGQEAAAENSEAATSELVQERISEPEEAIAAVDDFVAVDDAATVDEGVAADESILADVDIAAGPGDPADKAASQTLGLLRRFRPGQSLDAELDAYERERGEAESVEAGASTEAPMDDLGALQAERMAAAAEAAETAPPPEVEVTEPVAAELEPAAEAPQPVAVEPEPEPVAAEVPEAVAAVELEPVAIDPEPVMAETPEPEQEPVPAASEEPTVPPIAAAAASDVVEQPTWRITAPDPTPATPAAPGVDHGGPVPLQASGAPAHPSAEPHWPARPEWRAASSSAAGLPFLGRPATPQGGIDALWAASNQELVTAQPAPGKAASGIQPCISCGLSLSATARFCRRCGTLQAR